MSIKEELKKEVAEEKKKFAQMSFQDKLWYIGEYYKFHILGVILVIALIGAIGSTVYRNIYYDTALSGYVLNNQGEPDSIPFTEGFAGHMGYDKYRQLTLQSSYVTYGEDASEYTYATMAKLSALIAAKDLDFMIVDQTNFVHYVEMGGFKDLEEYLPAHVYETVKDQLIYAEDEAGQSRPYAVSISGTDFAADSLLSDNCTYLAILNNTMRDDTVLAFVDYLFGIE